MTRRKVDLNKKRSKAIEAAISEEIEEQKLEEITFEIDGMEFKSIRAIPHSVGMHVGRLGNEDYSNASQSESLVYALEHLVAKEDRKDFSKWLEDQEYTTAEMLALFGAMLEEISNTPLDSSERPGPGTKATTTK